MLTPVVVYTRNISQRLVYLKTWFSVGVSVSGGEIMECGWASRVHSLTRFQSILSASCLLLRSDLPVFHHSHRKTANTRPMSKKKKKPPSMKDTEKMAAIRQKVSELRTASRLPNLHNCEKPTLCGQQRTPHVTPPIESF